MLELTVATQARLIDRLVQELTLQGKEVERRETHISWIIMAGNHAWKIKKAVDFGFLDFSTLEKRRHFCKEELRLNRRFAPTLYLDVIPITGSIEDAAFDSHSTATEYAVHMRRFDESGLLSSLADTGLLTNRHIDAMADQLANYHQKAPVAKIDTPWGTPDQVYEWLKESVLHIKQLVTNSDREPQISQIDRCCHKLYQNIQTELLARKSNGFIRDCHGDLHLGNMVWLDEALVPFDCIEFNPALRWIDIMSEVAFVMMDLLERGYLKFAWRFINHNMMLTGDYAGVKVLRFYIVYRALVRAKVALLQYDEAETPALARKTLWQQAITYLDLAQRWLQQNRPVLIIMHGLSASGKSTVAAQLAQQYGCFHLRSDIERKRLHGLSALAKSGAAQDTGIYSSSATNQTYKKLYSLTSILLEAAYPVIVDATFITRANRDQFRALALTLNCPFTIIHCQAKKAILQKRLQTRSAQQADPSEATLNVLDQQIKQQDKLEQQEPFITVSASGTIKLPHAIVEALGYS